MTNKELVEILLRISREKTLYVNGAFGRNLTEDAKQYYINGWSYNRRIDRKPKIQKADSDTYGFDCICLIKAIRMGWNGDKNDPKCGVKYISAWDLTEKGILDSCTEKSNDFSKIEVGEYLYMSGHGGIYIGDGLAIECTPSWEDGVQITAVENIAKRSNYNGRKWTSHGKLPWVDYSRSYMKANVPVLQRGAKGEDVKRLQTLLNLRGAQLEVDGSFGPATEKAVKAFQKDHLLEVDGSCGGATWGVIIS